MYTKNHTRMPRTHQARKFIFLLYLFSFPFYITFNAFIATRICITLIFLYFKICYESKFIIIIRFPHFLFPSSLLPPFFFFFYCHLLSLLFSPFFSVFSSSHRSPNHGRRSREKINEASCKHLRPVHFVFTQI